MADTDFLSGQRAMWRSLGIVTGGNPLVSADEINLMYQTFEMQAIAAGYYNPIAGRIYSEMAAEFLYAAMETHRSRNKPTG